MGEAHQHLTEAVQMFVDDVDAINAGDWEEGAQDAALAHTWEAHEARIRHILGVCEFGWNIIHIRVFTRNRHIDVVLPQPVTAAAAAEHAARELGFNHQSNFTLAQGSTVIRYQDPAPESGDWELLDVGTGV